MAEALRKLASAGGESDGFCGGTRNSRRHMKTNRTIALFETFETRTLMSATPLAGTPKLGEEPGPSTTLPARASNLCAVATGRSVKLTWRDNSSNEAGFAIFRLSPTTHGLVLVGQVDANVTTFTEASAPLGNDVYLVRAVDASGKGEVSNAATVKVADLPKAVAPNKLQTRAVSTTSVQISWDGAKNAVGFQILRSTDGFNFTPVGTTDAKTHTFTDTGLTAATRYTYKIVAVGADGGTATSASVFGQTKASDRPEPAKNVTTTHK